MPEGPELKRSAEFLDKLLRGRRVYDIYNVGGRYAATPPAGMVEFLEAMNSRRGKLANTGAEDFHINQVGCKGKFMFWDLSPTHRPDWALWCTYGMSGQWSTVKDPKHCAVELFHRHRDGTVLEDHLPGIFFNDQRHFGTLKFVHDPDGSKTQKRLGSLGPDMLSDPPDEACFERRLGLKSTWTIAETLMNQAVISGVGNYVRAEALYLAEISPHRKVITLTTQESSRLRQQIINVMQASYRTGGATFSTYRNPNGNKGDAQRRFVVYGNPMDPLGNPVIKEDFGGRTMHWVPQVQR